MSRTQNAIKNIAYNIGYQLLMLLLGFINRSIFLYFLSVEYLGVQAIFKDILTLLSMADLGLVTAMTYSLYQPLADNNTQYISGLIHFYKKVCNLIALVILLGGLCLLPFLQYIIYLDREMPHLALYYILYLLNTVASYLVVYKTVILGADQKGYITAKYGSIFNILQNICLALFLWWTHHFLIYLIIQVAFTYLYNSVVSSIATKHYPYIKEKQPLPKEEARGIFKNIRSVFLYKISNVLISATDNTLISILVGTVTVGLYSNYMLVVSKIISLLTTAFTSLTASLGNLIVTEGQEKRHQIFQILQTICTILSMLMVVMLLFLLQDFIGLWLGDKYLLEDSVLAAIVINFYFSVILLPVWAYREATGLYHQIKYVMVVTALFNLGISILLGHFFGLSGILLGTSIAKLVTYFWYEPILLFNEFFGRSSVHYFTSIGKSLLVLGVLILLGFQLSQRFLVDSFMTLVVKGLLLFAVSSIVILSFYYRSAGVQYLKERIQNKVK